MLAKQDQQAMLLTGLVAWMKNISCLDPASYRIFRAAYGAEESTFIVEMTFASLTAFEEWRGLEKPNNSEWWVEFGDCLIDGRSRWEILSATALNDLSLTHGLE